MIQTILKAIKDKSLAALSWVRTHPKDSLYVISIVIALLVFTFRKSDIVTVQKGNVDLIQKVDYYRDREGKLVSKLKQNLLDKEEVQKRADSLAVLLKLKPKTIKGVDQYYYSTDTVFYPVPVKEYVKMDNGSIDTAYSVKKEDPWVTIKATAGPKTGKIEYSAKDTLTRVVSTKENAFNPFKGAETSVIMKNASPYNTLTSGYSFTIKERPTLFDVSLQTGYNPFTKQPYVGIGISKSLFKIKK